MKRCIFFYFLLSTLGKSAFVTVARHWRITKYKNSSKDGEGGKIDIKNKHNGVYFSSEVFEKNYNEYMYSCYTRKILFFLQKSQN